MNRLADATKLRGHSRGRMSAEWRAKRDYSQIAVVFNQKLGKSDVGLCDVMDVLDVFYLGA